MAHKAIQPTRNTKHDNAPGNDKATGTDGIPGGIYKITYKHMGSFIQELMNNITHGQSIPEQWAEGGIIYLHKKDSKKERNNYRPIFLTRIIYEIWPKFITNRLTQITHLPTPSTKYGYKSGLSTIDAIVKI